MTDPLFARYGNEDVRRLIAQYPLSWVMAPGAPVETATLLPMLGLYGEDGRLTGLLGHMSRRRTLHTLLCESPTAHFLFTGPQAYVSPQHSGRRNWGPTWNYAALRVEAQVRFDEALTEIAVRRLVDACEAGRDKPWQPAELGGRYDAMLGAIIGFEAQVTAIDATFKLAQDEDDAVLRELVEAHPDETMRSWIRALNRDRLD
ncbi:FMN-binding negative transcriptional regulator [Novosphingobium album (ex Hu et al. 2023)]|uniref:FMN-binding negative transcriptional regulator n=1 Tax=Novosphingobium album (ex Hu et al. 2023) TaxID=2930093 RepID=A0ABT0B007_9SPHN|nr:FMN-binding negative transcriptional regulator [Novosphingobium album (ex Hu et al. 2023)]MCJ2178397.1 FMN-binding negative transcriptional regulator [Novosphingobium album (ex Hu et al. 2023)]